jgi:transposase-like protein
MPREEGCIATLRELRWKDGVRCTKCGSSNVKKDGVRGLYQMYECKDCRSYFNDRTGTVFQDTKIPLRKWFLMAFLMQFNISILEVSKTVGVPYRNAFYIARKIRNGMYVNQILEKLKGRNRGDGRALHHCGREREKRASRNGRRTALKARGRGTYQRDKPPIIGMVSRETKRVSVSPSSGVTGRDIINRAVKNIDSGATIYHDDYRSYGILDGSFSHESVKPQRGRVRSRRYSHEHHRGSSLSSGPGCRPSGGYRRSTPTFTARTISSSGATGGWRGWRGRCRCSAYRRP